jgi:hypothetical protein
MDLDQLRKINTLSNELKRHGMANSSTDAYSQAEQIITITPKKTASEQETVVLEVPAQDALAERQAQMEIDRLKKAFNDELEVFRNTINQIISEVNSLREDLARVQSVQPPKQKEKQAELKTEVKETHPRQGNFQPGDVDIQKMFYFGTKK